MLRLCQSLLRLTLPITLVLLQACTPTERQPLNVGVILPLTGDAAVYGTALKNGIELALEETKPNLPKDLKLIYEDDQASATQALSAAQKLIDLDKVPVIIGGAMSSTAESVIPLSKEKNVVLISPTATKASLTSMGAPFFRLWPSDNYDGAIMADAAINKLGIKRVAILYVNVAYGQGIAEVFKREFESRGGQIVAMEGYNQGAKDFRTQITKLKALKPDAVYLPGYVAEIGNILRQARELEFTSRFLGATGLKDDNLIKIAGDAAEGAVLTYPTYNPESTDLTITNFVRSYKSKYGDTPDAFAAQGYDAMRVLASVIGAGAKDANSIKQQLSKVKDYNGPGGKVTFDESGEVKKPLLLLTIQNGSFVPLEG